MDIKFTSMCDLITFQAQIVIEKMSELSTFDTGREEEDNANFRHPVDLEGNITGHMEGNITGPRRVEDEEVEGNSDSELTSSEETTTPGEMCKDRRNVQ